MELQHLTQAPGVYAIWNRHNGKLYIGSSERLLKRLIRHRSMLVRGVHPNLHLQAAWSCYGTTMFTAVVLEYVSEGDRHLLRARERYWLERLKTTDRQFGYNATSRTTGGMTSHSEATRQKMSRTRRGRPHTTEHTESISKALKGRAPDQVVMKAAFTPAAIARRALARSRHYRIVDPQGRIFIIRGLYAFCYAHGLRPELMVRVASERCTHHQGWTCERLGKELSEEYSNSDVIVYHSQF